MDEFNYLGEWFQNLFKMNTEAIQPYMMKLINELDELEHGESLALSLNIKKRLDGNFEVSSNTADTKNTADIQDALINIEEDRDVKLIEFGDMVSFTTEIPHIDSSDIKIKVTRDKIDLFVKGDLIKSINLSYPVKPSTTKATYMNNVLDVCMKKL